MSYFQRACEYYLRLTGPGKYQLIARCKAKYARGVNVVAVSATALGDTFAADHCDVDPGRIFLTYERLIGEALIGVGVAEYGPLLDTLRDRIATYNPDTTLLWLCMLTGCEASEMHVFET